MPALSFPNNPVDGQRYPANPGVNGTCQFEWDSSKGVWNIVPSYVKLNDQSAFNDYQWPAAPSAEGLMLSTDADGVLSWSEESPPVAKSLGLLESFDDFETEFTLVEAGTTTPFTPSPSSNIVVFLGGVPQIPGTGSAYTVTGNKIKFSEAPAIGTNFYAFSLVKG